MLFVPYTEVDFEIANSYLSIADADALIAGQNNNGVWSAYTDEVKQTMLMQSSLAVDGALMYKGSKTSSLQVLKFPRDGSYTLPPNIKFAVVFMCLKYSNDKAFKNITKETISKLSWEFKNVNDTIGADVLAYLKPLKATSIKVGASSD